MRLGVQPDRAGFGLAELGAVGLGDQREGQAEAGHAELPADQVGAGGDVAPLVGAADLQLAALLAPQPVEVVGLQQHVAELGVRQPGFALEPRAHAVLRDHHVDREVLADLAQEVEVVERHGPVGVVHQFCRIRAVEVQQLRELGLDRRDVVFELFPGQQVALGRLAGGIADHPGGAAGQRQRLVAGELEAAQHQLAHQMPDVQAVRGRIEAAVERDRPLGEPLAQAVEIRAVGDQVAVFEVGDQVHGAGDEAPGERRANPRW